ncbi:MarR family winged helix-turn-helix transcriptional regulator [Derxia gummosa]|uniref:MarR family winged helix-turn-helix transcriptional regulator n=1 Tax=Derxia gummosa DSM 723 TaxID=1121388 RepID=A0A8B6X8I7_9BURK|nr:MarR family winged helix-turn-helix transcriptional regulator [Derxia gummosa]
MATRKRAPVAGAPAAGDSADTDSTAPDTDLPDADAGDLAPARRRAARRPALDQSWLEGSIGYHLARARVVTAGIFTRAIGEPLDLRPVEFTILMLLSSNEDVTQTQLSDLLAISAPNMTILLDRCVKRGIVRRVRSETDRRAQTVQLTDLGRDLARRGHAIALTMEREALPSLSPGEYLILIELLRKITRHSHPAE